MNHNKTLPLIGFAAWSGTGKTTLLKALLPRLKLRGIRAGCIKHAHHEFDVDKPGKDSYEIRHAGASQVLIASQKRWALMVEEVRDTDPSLQEMLQQLDHANLDLILVEGFKAEAYPKIELYRADVGKPWRFHEDEYIVAVACDELDQIPADCSLPRLNLNDLDEIETFILGYCGLDNQLGDQLDNQLESQSDNQSDTQSGTQAYAQDLADRQKRY